jgi:peptidoglycan biosynthesis protein MviN/MurJ (putative lipid II flippase)
LFIVLRAQIVRVIFGTGRFDWTDTRLTAAVLALFVVSVAAHNVMLLLLRGYYAAQSTKKPLWIVGIGSIMTIIIGYIALRITQGSEIFIDFVSKLLRIPATGDAIIVVLPLAYSIGIIIICITLWLSFKNDFKNNKKESLLPTITHASIVTILIGVVSYGVLQILAPLMNLNTFWGIFGQGFIAGVIGIIIGAMAFMYLRTPEFAMLVRRSRKKIRPILSMPQYPDKEI